MSTFQEAWRDEGNDRYQEQLQLDIQRSNLTTHGLRHSYAREQYEERIEHGMNPREARKEVAAVLGHGRDAVTRIYLKKDEDHD